MVIVSRGCPKAHVPSCGAIGSSIAILYSSSEFENSVSFTDAVTKGFSFTSAAGLVACPSMNLRNLCESCSGTQTWYRALVRLT